MKQDEIMEIFKETGAILSGHFLLTSGRHSDRYIQCARVLQYPRYAESLCCELARRYRDEKISAVVGPAIGGIIVAHEVARTLGTRAFFTERENGKMALRRGFTLSPGERVLVVEDVVTTGGSVMEVINLVKGMGAAVVGAGLLVDRSGGRADLGVRKEALLTVNVAAYEAEKCPLCREGVPLVKPGSRKFKETKMRKLT